MKDDILNYLDDLIYDYETKNHKLPDIILLNKKTLDKLIVLFKNYQKILDIKFTINGIFYYRGIKCQIDDSKLFITLK